MRVALRFAYDGAPSVFPNGYARQPDGGTVEDALIAACRQEGYMDGSWTTGSRTDKGVSAAENVAVCELDRPHLTGLVPALQRHLPAGLWVTGAAPVAVDWNPRHHAVRTYAYHALDNDEDLAAMTQACQCFVGTHDLSAFAKVEPHRDPQRDIATCQVERYDGMLRFTVASTGFLWNQVRRMVDAVLCVGRGDATPADIETSLESGVPHGKFDMAKPDGLWLESVAYDPDLAWDDAAGSIDLRRLEAPIQRSAVTASLLGALNASS